MTGPRFEAVAAELRERIALGDFGASGALESEAELGRRHEVSRVTVRKALERLRDEGLIAARKGAGWYVRSGTSFGQTLALGSFRHARSAVADAGLALTRTVTGYEYRPVPPDVATLLRTSGEALRVRAVRLAGGNPLDVVTEWVPLAFASPVSRADAEEPGVWETLRRQGHDIDVVRQSIAATAATESVARGLETTTGAPVLLVRRLAVRADGTPLALSEHRYLGHRFRLEVEFRGGPGTDPPGVMPVQ
ncbi:GntR family transcriptional regulator [Asanoa hainanensis]|uniref:GntR family transcriptional regulator n=1 Tax=Asanoa hainanensis TaxID=560556 RepID=A0A239ILI3_9ACTN|nr:GntR family transcriptional regulator [Asanoa hainanensis]SNS94409.1 GntR family transcriptional regulator [Asanoa hainanensis]